MTPSYRVDRACRLVASLVLAWSAMVRAFCQADEPVVAPPRDLTWVPASSRPIEPTERETARADNRVVPVQLLTVPDGETLPAPPVLSSAVGLDALPTTADRQLRFDGVTLTEALDEIRGQDVDAANILFVESAGALEINNVSLNLRDASPREALTALLTKYDLETFEQGRIVHIRKRGEFAPDLFDPGYRDRLKKLYAELEKEINATFPDSTVSLTVVGEQIVIRGEAKDALEAEQILTLVARNPPPARGDDGSGETTFSVTQAVRNALGQATSVTAQGDATSILGSDPASDPPHVVNLLRIVGEQQVMLRVTVAELNRTAARSIGLSFSVQNSSGTEVFNSLFPGLGTGGTAMMPGFTFGGEANLPAMIDNGQVSLAINALRELNLARTLAEPNLTALNGRLATFRAGGRFPIPVAVASAGAAVQGVEFESFGVLLEFMPFILDRDRIRLKVAAEVSVRDPDLGTNIGGDPNQSGTSVPGLDERSFETTVELRDGQTLAVAGLLQTSYVADADRVPLWGDLPLIGRTGAYDRTETIEQELVILVTPELVRPLESCEPLPVPGHDVFEPGDIEFYLLGRLESRRAEDFRSPARTDFDKQISYERVEDAVLIGPDGYSTHCSDCVEHYGP